MFKVENKDTRTTDFSSGSFLAQLMDFVLTGVDKGMHNGMILINLQKSFATLGHKIILEKMTCLGFKAPLIKWLESYVWKRRIFLSFPFRGVSTEAVNLKFGVPEGSVLGPLLFYVLINRHIKIKKPWVHFIKKKKKTDRKWM